MQINQQFLTNQNQASLINHPLFMALCSRLHYKECLVELINQNRLDPVVMLEVPELRAELDRWRIRIPEKQALESEKLYKERLRQVRQDLYVHSVAVCLQYAMTMELYLSV